MVEHQGLTMLYETNEYARRMWTDKLHRVEVTECSGRASDGPSCLGGWLVADTPEAVQTNPRPANVPFQVVIPEGLGDWDFHCVMATMFNRLQAGQPLMNLSFVPEPPPVLVTTEANVNWGGIALFAFGAVALGAAFSSRRWELKMQRAPSTSTRVWNGEHRRG